MRSAPRPNMLSVGTRSKKAMSSSIAMSPLASRFRSSSILAAPSIRTSKSKGRLQLYDSSAPLLNPKSAIGLTALACELRVRGTSSRHQFVAAGFGHQDRRGRRIPLDLLPQPVDVSFERMRRHPRIIAPHLL